MGTSSSSDVPCAPPEQQELNEVRDQPTQNDSSANEAASQEEAMDTWDATLRREGAIYSKVSRVQAKRMSEKGSIDTVVGGKIVQTQRPYDVGDYVMCGSRQTSTGAFSFYPVKQSDFSLRYDTSDTNPAVDPMLDMAGFRSYKPKGKVWSHRLTHDELALHFPSGKLTGKCTCVSLVLTSPLCYNYRLSIVLVCDVLLGGGIVEIAPGDVVVMPFPDGGEVYSIKGRLFDSTYDPEDSQCRVTANEALAVKPPATELSSSSGFPLVSSRAASRFSVMGAIGWANEPVSRFKLDRTKDKSAIISRGDLSSTGEEADGGAVVVELTIKQANESNLEI